MRTAIRRNQDRRNVLAEPAANVPNGGDAVAAIEMIIDQKTSNGSTGRPDRLDGGIGIGHRDNLGVPCCQ